MHWSRPLSAPPRRPLLVAVALPLGSHCFGVGTELCDFCAGAGQQLAAQFVIALERLLFLPALLDLIRLRGEVFDGLPVPLVLLPDRFRVHHARAAKAADLVAQMLGFRDRKSTRLNSSH